MQRRREQHTRSENPEESPFRAEPLHRRPGDDTQHDHRGSIPRTHGTGDDRLQESERSLHEAPMLGVGAQAGEEFRARVGVGQIQAGEHHEEPEHEAWAQPSGQRRKGRQWRELGERRQRSGRTRRSRGSGEENEKRDPEEPQGLQVGVPSHLDDQQWRPEVQHLGEAPTSPGDACDLAQQPSGGQIESQPKKLRLEDRAACQGDDEECHLGEGRIDRVDVGVVDPAVPSRPELRQRGVGGGVQVGIHTGELDMTVPQVSVDVVGQFRRHGQEGQAQGYGHHPDEDVAAHTVEDPARRHRVHDEGRREEQHSHPREGRPRPPAHRGQEQQLRDACGHQEPPGLPADWERR